MSMLIATFMIIDNLSLDCSFFYWAAVIGRAIKLDQNPVIRTTLQFLFQTLFGEIGNRSLFL